MLAVVRSTRILGALVALVVAGTLATQTVEVLPGDTLSEIASETGVTVADLVEWNGIADPDLIIAGENLLIRVDDGDGTFSTHVVEPGDTLWILAGRFGMTVDQLMSANDLSNPDYIVVGQVLTAGDEKTDADSYTVELGDTLLRIARSHGVTTRDLVETNDLRDPDRIVAGQHLTIPTGPTPAEPTPVPDPVTTTTTTPAATPTTTAPAVAPTTTVAPSTSPDPSSAIGLTGYFDTWTAAYGVDRGLLEALLWVKSGWQPTATGPDGQLGIAQLSVTTATFVQERLLGLDLDPLDASDGIRMAARYLRYLRDSTDSDRSALAAWHQGLDSFNTNGMSAPAGQFADDVLAVKSQRSQP